ncbi:hypothetical protein IIV30_043L [Invertebrate iridescent virus 30]|uniref:Uncharacterized protein n=1 Tax=Invertebrate iridescent virus 30 TaxID=345585 RepID=W8W1Q2_9VIRU|nr:hypothetical protein IIV30_043L [Invertebrate iridescent virus 30]CCV02238.1 hypothetical protein IIV30_043L [Invertebrate iridescent virus 30]
MGLNFFIVLLSIQLGLMCKLTGETCGAFYPTPCCNRCVISGPTAWGYCN